MADLIIAEKSQLVDIADAIRAKTETTDSLSLIEMPQMIASIETGSDLSMVTATASDVLSPKVIVDSEGIEQVGVIPTKTTSDLIASGATISVPAGYYASAASKSVGTATQATPSISGNSSGLITASATQTAGYVSAGTKSATKQLTVQAATTITPSSSSQTAVVSGVYTTGAVTVAAVPTQTKTVTPSSSSQNITPDSGKFLSKVTVAAIPESYMELNFTVVGGTSQPTSPKENTVWVNTSTSISSWVFSATQPSEPSAGMVWFQTGTSAPALFNTLKKNNITVYPNGCKQYVSGAWTSKTAKTYQSGAWKDWILYLIKNGDCTEVTGGWEVSHSGAYGDGSFTVNEQGLYWVTPWNNSDGGYTNIRHKNNIDLTNFKTLHFYVAELSGSSLDKCTAYIKSATDNSVLASVSFLNARGNPAWFTIDVTSIKVLGYLYFDTGAGVKTRVSEIRFE